MRRTHYMSSSPEGTFEQWNAGDYPRNTFFKNLFLTYSEVSFPLALFTIGATQWCRGVKRRQENSVTASIEFIQDGIFSFNQSGRRYELKAGDVILLEPFTKREMECLSPKAQKSVVIFGGISIRHLIEVLGIQEVDVFRSGATEKFMGLYETMLRLVHENTCESLFQTSSVIYSMLLELASRHAANSEKRPEALRLAIEYIFRNIERNVDNGELCRVTGMSQMSLYRLFNEHLGMPPVHYIRKLKLEHAAELLSENSLSVKEIAARLDYSSPQYFSSVFKKHFGKTPKQHSATHLI